MCLPFCDLAERTLAKGKHRGFEWEVVHNNAGYRCGYVRVEPDHPWYGKSYSDFYDHETFESLPNSPHVHGGVTFAEYGKARPTHDEKAEWWIGFDCAHGFDAPDPNLPSKYPTDVKELLNIGGEIRTQAYVEAECRDLCEQALKAKQVAT